MWGKSPRYSQATDHTGKPYGLKDQIYLKVFCKGNKELPALFRGVGRWIPEVTPELDK
jgi:hypothetical protein